MDKHDIEIQIKKSINSDFESKISNLIYFKKFVL